MRDMINNFIQSRFPCDSNWLSGNCYYFAVILAERFVGEIYYDVVNGHFVTYIPVADAFYDWSGEISPDINNLVKWDEFVDYDYLQYTRIVNDCIK